MKPNKLVILGKEYSISYCDKPSEVDIFKRESMWGQVDFWTYSIRIYDDGKRVLSDVWETIIHEILHVINYELGIKKMLKKADVNEEDMVDLLALALTDTLVRNNLLVLEKKK